jgi:hypothetical protein
MSGERYRLTWASSFSFLWHKFLVLIFNMFIYAKVGHSIFVEMHGDTSEFYRSASKSDWYFLFKIAIYLYNYLHADRPVWTLIPLQLKNRLWTTVVLFHCCTLIWGLTNNNYSLYLLQFLTVSVNIYVCAIFVFPGYIYIVGPLSKLAETYFFCWRLHKYDLLQFVWY